MNSDELFSDAAEQEGRSLAVPGRTAGEQGDQAQPEPQQATAIDSPRSLNIWLRHTAEAARHGLLGPKRTSASARTRTRTSGSTWRCPRPEQAATTGKKASFVEGPPVLAVEVLSPYDKHKDINEAMEEYLDCGVKLVWIVDPYDDTVTVYRPGHEAGLVQRRPRAVRRPRTARVPLSRRRDLRVADHAPPPAAGRVRARLLCLRAARQDVPGAPRAGHGAAVVRGAGLLLLQPGRGPRRRRPGVGPEGERRPRLRTGTRLRHRHSRPATCRPTTPRWTASPGSRS